MFRIKDTVHILLKKRRAVNNNTLRDAQKRQKTPFRAVQLGIFVQNAHENTSRNMGRVNSNFELPSVGYIKS